MTKKILEMVESVDPKDRKALDEIDARVWCWYFKKEYEAHSIHHYLGDGSIYVMFTNKGKRGGAYYKKYTRSRDALKSIRPEGWWFEVRPFFEPDQGVHYNCHSGIWHDGIKFYGRDLPTEELEELYAIIQALEYDSLEISLIIGN